MDIAIIGAGPSGLFASFEAGRLGLRSVIIDSLEEIGGQCVALYPEKPIYDIPAFPSILAKDLISNLKEQASRFAPVYYLGQLVEKISGQSGNWELTTSLDNVIHAKAIIIASGSGAFGPIKPQIHNIEEYEQKSLFYQVNKPDDFAGRNVVIVGGGDSATDWAMVLSDIANKIYLVHRRDKFRCVASTLDKIKQRSDKIEIVTPYHLQELVGNDGQIKKVILRTLAGAVREIEADLVLPFLGISADLGPIKNWGIDLASKRIVVNPATLSSNVQGIYAIGDIATYPGKLKLILNAFSEGAMACRHIYNLIYPSEVLGFQYSTNDVVFS